MDRSSLRALVPPFDDHPVSEATLAPAGLQRESVRYGSGDRFELTNDKKSVIVSGKVGSAGRSKEMKYTGKIQDTLTDGKRLATREVFAHGQGDPDLYLYRKLDYAYGADGRLERIEFKSWTYRGASDWKEKPSTWVRHNAGTIALRRENGLLSKIETTLREAGRSLRGELEYREPRSMTEQVVHDADKFDRVVRSTP